MHMQQVQEPFQSVYRCVLFVEAYPVFNAGIVRRIETDIVTTGPDAQVLGVWCLDQEARLNNFVAVALGQFLGRVGEVRPAPGCDLIGVGCNARLIKQIGVEEDLVAVRPLAQYAVLRRALCRLQQRAVEEVFRRQVRRYFDGGCQVQQCALVVEVTGPVHRAVHDVGRIVGRMRRQEFYEILTEGNVLIVQLQLRVRLSQGHRQPVEQRFAGRIGGGAPPVPVGDRLLGHGGLIRCHVAGCPLPRRRATGRQRGCADSRKGCNRRQPQKIATTYSFLREFHTFLLWIGKPGIS